MKRNGKSGTPPGEPVAGNGILSRRVFLESALATGAATAGVSAASAQPLAIEPWMKIPGAGFEAYGQPSKFESKVVRLVPPPPNPATQGVGTARTPLHLLDGIITPSGLHFERSHSGVPNIDPDRHRIVIHGLGSGRWCSRSKRWRAIRWSRGSRSSSAAATPLR